MDRKTGEGIQEAKGEVYKRTSVSCIRFRQKIRMKVDVSDYYKVTISSWEGCDSGSLQ